MRENYEEHERTLEPHRVEEQRNARQEATDRLRDRSIPVLARDGDEEVADVLEAIEQFESAVEALGGDLMVNRIGATEPQDPSFAPPARGHDQRAYDYIAQVRAATAALRRRQRAD